MLGNGKHALPWLVVTLASLLASAEATWGCNIPVFRYALENWRPDPYQILVVSRGPLTEQQQQLVIQLENAGMDAERPANSQVYSLDLEQRDLAKLLEDEIRGPRAPVWAIEQLSAKLESTAAGSPRMVVLYPHVWDRTAWDVPLSAEHVEQLIDSPLRQEVARRLLDGQSAVWVLLESGDAAADQAAWERLQAELTRSADTVQLPARELIESDDEFRADVEIQLRVEFSALRLASSDPTEQAFASLLRGSEADLREFQKPIAVPIYGRGRTYFALVGDGINPDLIEENCQFLCAACSCQVKQENPGVDMLMAVAWDANIQGSAMPDLVLPELTGIGGLEMASFPSAKTPPASAPPDSAVQASPDGSAAPEGSPTGAATGPVREEADTAASSARGPAQTARDASRATPTGSEPHSATNASVEVDLDEDIADGVPRESGGFERQLLYGVVGGIALAVVLLTVGTFWLQRGA